MKQVYLVKDLLFFFSSLPVMHISVVRSVFSFLMICTVESQTTICLWLCSGKQYSVPKGKKLCVGMGERGWVANYKLTKEKGRGMEGITRGFLFPSSNGVGGR